MNSKQNIVFLIFKPVNKNSKKFSTFIAFAFGLIIVYSVVFINTIANLKEEFKYAFKSKENYLFHKEYTNKLHHVRDESSLEMTINKSGVHDLLFTNIFTGGNKTILFQGDSWINQIETLNNKKQQYSFKNLKTFGIEKKVNLISAGIPSYSPSLMNLQLDTLENDFDIQPETIVAFINQLDFGDEICRYKNNKIYKNSKFVKIKTEENNEGVGWYNYSKVYGISEINFQSNSNFSKTFKLINFKLIYSIKKNFRRLKTALFQKHLIEKKFNNNEIEKYLIDPNDQDVKYFIKTIVEYLKKIDEKKHVKNLILVTFPHKKHFIKDGENESLFKINVADLVDKAILKQKNILNKKNIVHLNLNKIFLNKTDFNHNIIWSKDGVHLTPENHYNLFIKNILKEINYLL